MASVFERVRSAVAVLEEVVGELEPGTLDVTGAKKLVDLFTRGERVSVAGRAVAARRVAAATDWKRSGHRSAAHWFASATGVGVGAASREMETARQLESLPETETAFRAGELSPAQARDIATAASVAPHAERELLEKARSSSMKALRDACREAACRAQDDRAWAQRLHESRRVHIRTGLDGMYEANVRLAPDEGARFDSALQSKTDELFQAARAAGRREPRAAYMADALVALVTGTSPLAKPVETRLNVSYEAVKRGHVEPGEVCELVGIGPIPVAMARALLNDARVTVMAHDGADIVSVSSPERTIPARLRRWVEAAYPVCGNEGCDSAHRLQMDHVHPVEQGGPTEKDNLWRLCGHDHRLKTLYGWQVDGSPGHWRLVPPDHDADSGPDP